jgi:hypothetical protein
MEPRLLDDPVIIGIAQRLRKTPAQVVLAWAVQRGRIGERRTGYQSYSSIGWGGALH